jgi:hypothetical protein
VIYGHAWAGQAIAGEVNPVREMRRSMSVEFEHYLRLAGKPGEEGDQGENT